MQDKDFDRLLKERFDAFEVQPSASTWNKITAKLDQKPKRKKMLPSYWLAAASVIILASAVLWLYKPVEVVKLHPEAPVPLVVNKKGQSPENSILGEVPEKGETVSAGIKSSMPLEKVRIIASSKSHAIKFEKPKKETSTQQVNKVADDPGVMIARQEVVVPTDIPNPLVVTDDNATRLANADDENVENSPEHESRHRIKSIGSLVNFVVAQVDKRENKIIEFKDGEEGSEVSGINLGVLKFKSRNK